MMQNTGPSQRQLRAGELVRHALADVFLRGDTGDPEIERLRPSVVEVSMSPDLRIATAYVRPLAEGESEALITALERNRRYIRGLLAPKLDMRYMPEIRFKIDTALDYAEKIDQLLKDPAVARDLEPEKEKLDLGFDKELDDDIDKDLERDLDKG
jgi:ribosome-binding factor A